MMTSTAREISNYDDVIDSRDVIARIEELSELVQEGVDDTEDDRNELATLRALATEGEALEDWEYGATLIRDSYFVEYAQEFAEEVVTGMSNAQWPFTCIDWERAAWELRMNYTSVEYDGVTYWAR